MSAGPFTKAVMALGLLAMIGAAAPAHDAGASQGVSASGRHGRTRFFARLHGGNETPAVFTTGRGFAVLSIDDNAQTIDFVLSYDNLEGAVTNVAHVHFGQSNVAGGVSFFLCGGPTTDPCTPTSGNISGTATAADIVGPEGQGIAPGEFAEVAAAIRAGLAYANVHTDKHPGGEIRGQLR